MDYSLESIFLDFQKSVRLTSQSLFKNASFPKKAYIDCFPPFLGLEAFLNKLLEVNRMYFPKSERNSLEEIVKGGYILLLRHLSWKLRSGENAPFSCFWDFFGHFSTFFGVTGEKVLLKIWNSKNKNFSYFLNLQGCCVPNSRSLVLKLWPEASGHTAIQTYGHTCRGPKQGTPQHFNNGILGF